jgi:hypothetical protein
MTRRRRKHKKVFKCKHRGFGKYCHRCHSLKQQKIVKYQQELEKKKEWEKSFKSDLIDLTHLPKKIVVKARKIIDELGNGIGFWNLHGKRFSFDRTLVRIPVTYRYRMLCRFNGKHITPIEVMSHERYNHVSSGKKAI